MTKLFTVIMLSLALSSVAHAGTYTDALKACGAEWRASEARKAVKTGEGNAAWQTFRKECTRRVGWDSKSGGSARFSK